MDKTITIKSVEIIKQGKNEKTGKDWTLFKIFVDGDQEMGEFSTFNPDYQNSEGQQMRGNFEYDSKWKNWKEVSVKQEEETSKHEELLKAVKFTAEQNVKILEGIEDITNFFIQKNDKQPDTKQPDTIGAEESTPANPESPRI